MLTSDFARDGYAATEPLFDAGRMADLAAAVADLHVAMAGTRNLLPLPWCASLASQLRKHPEIARHVDESLLAVQCTYFEKSPERNWLVTLHQDLSIPVSERVEHPALAGWSVKEDGVFVQPPSAVLDEIVAVRLHLDDCGANDGPLRVVPGSHRHGRLSSDEAAKLRDRRGEVSCTVDAGAALIMRPLLLHSSSKAHGNSRRRVLHFVFAPAALPYGLRWRTAV